MLLPQPFPPSQFPWTPAFLQFLRSTGLPSGHFCLEGPCSPWPSCIWSLSTLLSGLTQLRSPGSISFVCSYILREALCFFFKVLILFCNYTPITMIIWLSPTRTVAVWEQGLCLVLLSVQPSSTSSFVVEWIKIRCDLSTKESWKITGHTYI